MKSSKRCGELNFNTYRWWWRWNYNINEIKRENIELKNYDM